MKIIIFGMGEFSKQLHFYLTQYKDYDVEFFCVNKEFQFEKYFLGKPVINLEDDLKDLSPKKYKFLLGVGYKQLRMRKSIFKSIKSKGFDFINYIHPSVELHNNAIGEGNILFSNVVVEPFTSIGDNNIIWTNSTICHDCTIGDHNFIAANSVIGGFSKVLEGNFLGFSAVVKDNVIVNKEVLIGANSLVVNSPESYSMYVGNPAKKVKEHFEKGININ